MRKRNRGAQWAFRSRHLRAQGCGVRNRSESLRISPSVEPVESRVLLSVSSITIQSPSFQEGTAWPSSGLAEIATFTANDNGTPNQYAVTINWGDGTAPSSALVVEDPIDSSSPPPSPLVYDINSAHTYRNAGDYTIAISIHDSVDATDASTTPNEGQVVVAAQTLSPATIQPTLQAVVGTALNGAEVASFTSANPMALPGDFNASIGWGDGTISAGTIVQDASGAFHVDGTHTYTSVPAGGQLSVTIEHPGATGANASLTLSNAVTVSPAALTLAPGTVTLSDSSIQSGQLVLPAGTVLGTFTDTGGPGATAHYTSASSYAQFPGASVTNTPITIVPTVANGSTYTIETAAATVFATPPMPGTVPFGITIENTADGSIVQGNGSLLVTDAPLGPPINAQPTIPQETRGAAFTATVASFTEPDTLATPGDFLATINWGDGSTPSLGTVTETSSPNPNVLAFLIAGTHTYTSAGSYTVTVEVKGLASTIALTSGAPVTVVGANLDLPAPSLVVSDASINTQGQSYIPAGTVVGTFTDTGGNDPAVDYYGLGSFASFPGSSAETPVVVSPVVPGCSTFKVTTSADTVFTSPLAPGMSSYTLQITNSDGAVSQSATGTLRVVEAALGVSALGQPMIPVQVRGGAFTATLASFDNADLLATPSNFEATINWGDATSSPGVIVGGDGAFQVVGTHTYLGASPSGGYPISVSIHGVAPFTDALTTANTVTVTGSPLQVSASAVMISAASINAMGQASIPAGTVVGTFTDLGGAQAAMNYGGAGSFVSFAGAAGRTPIAVSPSGSGFVVTTAALTLIQTPMVPGTSPFLLQVAGTDGSISASAAGTLDITRASVAGPQVVGYSFNRATDTVNVTVNDPYAAIDPSSLIDPANYRVSRRFAERGPNLVRSVAVAAPSSGTGQETVTLQLGGAPIRRGYYFLTVYSGGLKDLSGNPLGEKSGGGSLVSGSNFVGSFLGNARRLARPVAYRMGMPAHGHPSGPALAYREMRAHRLTELAMGTIAAGPVHRRLPLV